MLIGLSYVPFWDGADGEGAGTGAGARGAGTTPVLGLCGIAVLGALGGGLAPNVPYPGGGF